MDWSQERYITQLWTAREKGQPIMPLMDMPRWLSDGLDTCDHIIGTERRRQQDAARERIYGR